MNIAQVSVVIPCFCCAKTLRRAVKSVLLQTLVPAEIILIDDASPDYGETKRCIQDIISNQSVGLQCEIRVIYLKQNLGPGGARNAGWEIATQPYIAFLDADDSWFPRKIEYQYFWMLANPSFNISCHQHVVLTENMLNLANDEILNKNISHKEISAKQLLFFNTIATRTVMLERKIHLRFCDGVRYSEDFLLWLSIIFKGFRFAEINLTLAASYKASFGVSGLSSNLLKMEIGELNCLLSLYRQNYVGFMYFSTAVFFSILKFIRRLIYAFLKRLLNILDDF